MIFFQKIFLITILLLSGIFMSSCDQIQSQNSTDNEAEGEAVVLQEAFQTDRDEGDNVDSPAVWHGSEGQNWLLATAKEGNTIIAYNAEDGSFIERFGDGGSGAGQFERPNGIAVIDDLVLVVERDNQRVQVFTLPEFESIGTFTHEDLRLPYGLTIDRVEENTYEVFVTDNFNPTLEGYPPEEELDERIHHFRFTINENGLESEHLNVFGEISGNGILHKVESIYSDRDHNRLMIANEAFSERNIKVYDLEGNFTGEVIPNRYFDSEPEGITLYSCEDNSGYWIMTDQHETSINKFQIFDRETLEHIGTFKGEMTRNTDGIWLTQQSFGDFDKGAFFPVHDDGSVTAIGWREIAEALSLDKDCSI